MRLSKVLNSSLPAVLLGLICLGAPVAAQHEKPANPQLPDPASTQQQPPANTQPGSESSPGSQNPQKSQGQTGEEANGGNINSQTQRTFSGKIVKSKDEFLLKDTTSNTTYKLDRQDLAKQYRGKQVKVTGTLDSSDNTIRVAAIEPLSS